MLTRLSLLVLSIGCILINRPIYGQYVSKLPDPIPLIHKSPYLNVWIGAGGDATTPADRWPTFFSGPLVRWMIGARVDGISYIFQGIHVNYTVARTIRTNITPTRTIFTIEAGPMTAELTFLTPIELNDWALHSLPFAYISVNLTSTDGRPHSVQLYTDVTGQFVSSNPENVIVWNTSFTSTSIYLQAQQRSIQVMTENSDMSEDGTQVLAYTATPEVSMTWQTCGSEICRVGFVANGRLANTSDSVYRVIGGDWPVLALAFDLGSITQTSKPLSFALGLVREPVGQYQIAGGLQNRTQLWWTKWSSVGAAVDGFLSGFSSALSRAVAFDNKLTTDSSTAATKFGLTSSAGTNLTDLVILNLRQTIGSLEITTSRIFNEKPAMNDLRVFMKDMGSSRRVNPVEIIYASFPAFLYLNASLAGALLEPLLEFQVSPVLYNKGYASPDLGNSWPNVLGNNTDQSSLAVENCGSMLIMVLAHAKKSGNGRLIIKYYDVLRKWADFLVDNSLHQTGFMTADGILGNSSNLAIKGITGIYAMGAINRVLEARGADSTRTSHYFNTASNYSQQWQNMALAADHIASIYGNDSSWGLLYNLYAPRLIQANIFSDRVYELQATFYTSQIAKADLYGIPFDSSQQGIGKSHWSLFTASSIFNDTLNSGRDDLINLVHTRAFANPGWLPNPSTYSVVNGLPMLGAASPALGAAYAFLAMNMPDVDVKLSSDAIGNGTSNPNGTSDGTSRKRNLAPIIGGVAALLLLVGATLFWVRHRRRMRGEAPAFDSLLMGRKKTRASIITPFAAIRSPEVLHSPSTPLTMLSPLEKLRKPPSMVSGSTPVSDLSTGLQSSVTDSVDAFNVYAKVESTPEETLRREVEELRTENEVLRLQIPAVRTHGEHLDEAPPEYANL